MLPPRLSCSPQRFYSPDDVPEQPLPSPARDESLEVLEEELDEQGLDEGTRQLPERSPSPPAGANEPHARRIAYNRRRPPNVDLEELSRVTVLPKLQQTMAFIIAIRNASFEDPMAKMTNAMLTRLRNPLEAPIEINSSGVRHSISVYLALEHASQNAYEGVIKSTRRNFPEAPGVENCLRFGAVEDLIAAYTGIESVEHHMCPNSCVGFTGPFENLVRCPTCDASRWDEAKLEATHGRLKVPAKIFTTLPLGPQLQALYRDPESARAMAHLHKRTQEILDEYERIQQIPVIDDIGAGWDYLGASLAGDIKEHDIVLLASVDGAQLYPDKESDCWLYIWVVLNLPPDKRYRKVHVLPGGFIPGPNKPKNVDSFMAVGLHHLSALQNEGLKIWDAAHNETFHSNIYLLFTTGDGPGLVHWNGLVGHCGKNGCRLYCGIRGRQKDSRSHYYPALLCPHNAHGNSSHADISSHQIPRGGSLEYSRNLFHLMSAPNQRQFELRCTETGISKAPLILGLHPVHLLGVPLCMTSDTMHLEALLAELMLALWRGSIPCMDTDDIATWDWAVLRDEQVWQAHGRTVKEAGGYLPGSFDAKPRNIAEKINTDYKTLEFIVYFFGLAPSLLYGILPQRYWKNFCRLVRGLQLLTQHEIKHNQVLEACVLLATWEREFEELYYQHRNDRLHFIRPCVHQVLHLASETLQKGPLICTAQWTIKRTIGNLKQEIRQPSNYLANFTNEGLRRARVNALLAALPELDDSRPSLPTTALDFGDGYALLQKCDKLPVLPSHGTGPAILDFLGQPRTGFPRIIRWARLSLPNGQIARSAWREKLKSPDKLRVSRMIKVCRIILSVIMYT